MSNKAIRLKTGCFTNNYSKRLSPNPRLTSGKHNAISCTIDKGCETYLLATQANPPLIELLVASSGPIAGFRGGLAVNALCQFGRMLVRTIEVKNLDGTMKVFIGNVPDPRCCIANNNQNLSRIFLEANAARSRCNQISARSICRPTSQAAGMNCKTCQAHFATSSRWRNQFNFRVNDQAQWRAEPRADYFLRAKPLYPRQPARSTAALVRRLTCPVSRHEGESLRMNVTKNRECPRLSAPRIDLTA